MKSVLILVCLTFALVPSAPAQQPDVREFVRPEAFPSSYRELTGSYDASIVPQLVEMLNSPTEKANHGRIAALLGAVGREGAADALIEFIEKPIGAPKLSSEEHDARYSAITSLGVFANRTGSDRALSYLIDGLTPSVWRQRNVEGIAPWAESYEQYDKILSTYALFALALSGHPAAGSALTSLRDSPTPAQAQFRTGLDDTLSQWLEVYDLVVERGLAGMYEHYEAERQAEGQRFAEEAKRIREERQRTQRAPEGQNRPQ